jgi:hypothetical protein
MNMNGLRFYTLGDIAILSQLSRISRMMQSIPSSSEETDAFFHFKENYYQNANFVQCQHYVQRLLEYKLQFGTYPTPHEFYLQFRPRLCLCEYSNQINDDEFVSAADFFMKQTGEVIRNCAQFYFFKEFCMLEHRAPNDIEEYNHYIASVILAAQNPDAFFSQPVVTRPISDSKTEQLKQTATIISDQSCGICQDDINNQHAVKLDCGHFFHANDGECCENGTIFNWLQTNRVCPICRHELS